MRNFIYFMLLLMMSGGGMAMEAQPLQSIRDEVRRFVEANVEQATGEVVVTVGQLDRRLRLTQCEMPLQAYFPSHVKPLGNITVGVRCEGKKPWSLMVQARVQQFISVVTASRPLGRGQTLGSRDIKLLKTDISRISGGYYARPEAVKGMVLKRSVRAGTVLNTAMLTPAIVIKRGEKVTIYAISGTIDVRMEGKALSAGAKGEVIEVKNLSSGKVIEAEVVSPGVVKVRI